MEAQIKSLNGQDIPNFIGLGYANNLEFPPRKTTLFIFPFDLVYNASLTNIANDPAIQLLRSNCFVRPQRQIPVRVKLTVDISAISWLGIRPSFTFDQQADCPTFQSLQDLGF